jgi:hypothetical protein
MAYEKHVVLAHQARQTLHFVWHYPDHEPRKSDPHYGDFQAAKKRLKEQGLWRCVVCGSAEQVQLHHAHVEFSLQNGVDVGRLNEALGLHLGTDEFAAWIDSPGNLEPLCRTHHTGTEGVHQLCAPAWEALRVWRRDLPPPEELVPAEEDFCEKTD